MKKRDITLLTIVLCFIIWSSCSQRNITLTGYSIFDIDNGQDSVLVEKKVYNDKFALVEEINYFFQDDKLNSIKLKYNKNEKLIFKESFLRDSTYITKVEFKRNSNGDIIKQIFHEKDGEFVLNHINEYENGKLIKSSFENKLLATNNDASKDYFTYFYNSKGKLENFKQYSNGTILINDYYKYDPNGNKILDSSAINNNKTIYNYDDNNQIIWKEDYNADSLERKTEIIWDGQLPKKKTITYFKDNFVEVIIYKKEN